MTAHPSALRGKCFIARTAVVALRRRGREPRLVTLAFPARWKRSTLLAYVRRQHPGETARVIEWRETGGWTPSLWLLNPEAFSDYMRGIQWEAPRAQ